MAISIICFFQAGLNQLHNDFLPAVAFPTLCTLQPEHDVQEGFPVSTRRGTTIFTRGMIV
jgi:hypothetical protein